MRAKAVCSVTPKVASTGVGVGWALLWQSGLDSLTPLLCDLEGVPGFLWACFLIHKLRKLD